MAQDAAEAAVPSLKETYHKPVVPRKIQQLRFDIFSPEEVVKNAEIGIYSSTLYERPERNPQANGVLDKRMGVSGKKGQCETCGQMQQECTGHFGHIQLELPVFHIGYLKATQQILTCICKTCARVLLTEEDRRLRLRQSAAVAQDRFKRQAVFRQVLDKCKATRRCPHCGSGNGTVKKAAGVLKLVHEKYLKDPEARGTYLQEFTEATQANEAIKPLLARIADELNPLRALELFKRVSMDDCMLLALNGRPEHLLLTHVPVPPVCIRPSVEMDTGGSNEDDLTIKLTEIVTTNRVLRECMETGQPPYKLVEAWDQVQLQTATLLNADQPGLQAGGHAPGKPMRGLAQRLKGKQGRFRGNLSGKRVDFTGRTVISPDPNLGIHEVAVPLAVARTLTFPERVTSHNIESLRRAVLNGAWEWPGANFVMDQKESKTMLQYADRARAARELRIGDTVNRHLRNGDVVLFNRQPSLHRISIMAHRVRVLPWRYATVEHAVLTHLTLQETFRFNECVCSPYNADFDGDEMNLHVPQTVEARTEAATLMGVTHNLCTPKNGEILVAATQDFLTSAFLMTSRDVFLTRAEAGRLACFMGDAAGSVDLPTPAVLKPLELWTGKQIFSLLMRPHGNVRIRVNLETKEKAHKPGSAPVCPNDAWVCFRNSELVAGRLGKATLGGGNKAGLFQVLANDYSSAAAAAVMGRLAKLSARFIGDRGFSIGIDDVMPAHLLQVEKQATVTDGYAACEELIAQYKSGKLELQAGCNMEESLETSVTGKLNAIRETASQVCMKTLQKHNSPLIMSQCGSKGSPINIAQMVACVGQQSVGGKRTPNGFQERSLPHFVRGDKAPAGKGFVANSFFSGLTPTEFFFHTMAGREGLVDTAVKTAETGYMSRRLMKALEDLFVHYDGTVRNSAQGIVQLEYGDDGRDPLAMEGSEGQPLDFERRLSHLRATTAPGGPSDPSDDARRRDHGEAVSSDVALPHTLAEQIPTALQQAFDMVDESPAARARLIMDVSARQGFIDSLGDFLRKQVAQYEAVRRKLRLPADTLGPAFSEHSAAAAAGMSVRELRAFAELCAQRFNRKQIDPGATVGAFGAQSIGEPGTQMTLKTFHFAGVASMNVTLGVPRIKEIINAAKTIATPIMDVALAVDDKEGSARIIKARLERTTLGQVAKWLRVVVQPTGAAVVIKLNMAAIRALQLEVTPWTVKQAIVRAPKLHLKLEHLMADREKVDEVWVRPPEKGAGAKALPLLFTLQNLMRVLPDVVVAGVPSVQRAVISQDTVNGQAKYKLVVEGTNLAAVLGMPGVKGTHSWSNHILEVKQVLGIEAARAKIQEQVTFTMGQHGMAIDPRHIMLLAETMTYKGDVLGMTRFGIGKMKDSVLMLASFEKTTDILFDAALRGTADNITGVSESIIMGMPMPVGTGLFKLHMQDSETAAPAAAQPEPLLA